MNNKFIWVDFYNEFANKLLDFKDNRLELIKKICKIYDETGISMPTLERYNKITDIDPFTVFGLFNKSSMREENRIKIITSIRKIFGITTDVPDSFDSIPVLNNQNATFYYFDDSRGDDDINDLWNLFESALKYAKDQSASNKELISHYFDLVINKKGNGNSKITMGLYWISPNTFMNLDSRNVWYIYESGKIPADIVAELPIIETKITANKYFAIVENLREYLKSENCALHDFKELSFEAWCCSTQVNEEKKAKKAQSQREQKGAGLADDDISDIRYWLYSPGEGACMWNDFYNRGVMGLGWHELGDYSQYNSKDEMIHYLKENKDPMKSYKNSGLATWQFYNDIKLGDIIFVKRGAYTIIGRGVVTSEYSYVSDGTEYPNIREVNWINNGEWEYPQKAPLKTLTDISPYTELVGKLNAIFEDEEGNGLEPDENMFPEYTPDNFLEEVFIDGDNYDTLVELVRTKKNVVLQGAPGVGKTFAAKRLAYSMMGCKDQNRVMMVQFHQSYSYEDFIEGFRPSSEFEGFEIKKGAFVKFCQRAADDLENEYFFIIDEINRGNLSKIFGELFMLVENDKRGNALQLLYSGDKFTVPTNLYIIGMMNTADRSLAMIDYALRRRFAFYDMQPGFNTKGFREYKTNLGNKRFDSLIDCVQKLNLEIANDESLGEGFMIGHSYFCNLTSVTESSLSNIIEYEIVPLLKEYWFDEQTKLKDWIERIRSSIK